MSDGSLFILSAPSGCGKSTMLRRLMQDLPGLVFSVSYTTRSPRANEINAQHYYFTQRKEFLQMRDAAPSGFLEWAEVHGNFYGTSRREVERLLATGNDVLLDIDVQGAKQVISQTEAVTVFIAPPSLQELERRLRGRGTEGEGMVSLRLQNAIAEMQEAPMYDFFIVNDLLEEAVESLRSIIIAERCRKRRRNNGNRGTVS